MKVPVLLALTRVVGGGQGDCAAGGIVRIAEARRDTIEAGCIAVVTDHHCLMEGVRCGQGG